MTARSALDLIVESTATTGTGTLTLDGAVSGYLALPSAADGQTFGYSLEDANGTARETGTGVYTHSGRTFTRTPIASTNSNAAISLSSGTHTFRVCPLADLFTGLTGNVQTQINNALPNVVYANKTDTASTTTDDNTWAATGLSCAITPRSTSSKILLLAAGIAAATNWAYFRFVNGSTPVEQGDTAGSKARVHSAGFLSASGVGVFQWGLIAVHSPASTSGQTYTTQFAINSQTGGTVYLNRGLSGEADNKNWPRGVSTMVAMEIYIP